MGQMLQGDEYLDANYRTKIADEGRGPVLAWAQAGGHTAIAAWIEAEYPGDGGQDDDTATDDRAGRGRRGKQNTAAAPAPETTAPGGW